METKPTNCEFHIATLDAAHDQACRDGLVIVIVRLGDSEQRQDLHRTYFYISLETLPVLAPDLLQDLAKVSEDF